MSNESISLGQHGILNNQLLLIYSLELNGWNETKLFRCEKYNRVRFIIGPSLYGRDICLMTNYIDDYTKFDRDNMKEINISDPQNNLQLCTSGSFHFIYTENKTEKILGSFYIVVSPEILIKGPFSKKSQLVSINSLQCQTLLSKLMGQIDTWKDKLQVSIKCNYNMIHWTPIQELGKSNSAYSLSNQHRINPKFRTEDMKSCNQECQLKDVGEIIEWLREQGVISIIDIVLNHTANESLWLKEHPESAYNCQNSPWLRPAFLLDRLLWYVTVDIENNRWLDHGISTEINNEHQLEIIRDIIYKEYLPLINLEEFYLCNNAVLIEQFEKFLLKYFFGNCDQLNCDSNAIRLPQVSEDNYTEIKLLQDPEYRRLNCTVDFENSFKFMLNEIKIELNQDNIKHWIQASLSHFKDVLNNLNDKKRQEIKNHIDSAIDNTLKSARYERFDPNGPKLKKITRNYPLATQYFTDTEISRDSIGDFSQKESNLYDDSKSCNYMAHNGWVMNDDPLKNFAEKDSWVYLRRELICWGDSVKLRYGQSANDSPFLWSYMENYVVQMASIFQGIRLDNCHSTPIHVAQHMVDTARRVNPNLYLIAELFTSNEDFDNIFVNKLGINSLIREAMSADTPFELGRQVYRFGGEPVGSFIPDNLKTNDNDQENLYSRPLVPSVTHAIFFDQTHDNESPIVRRTVYDTLPSTALVSMTYAATGSNRGFDELVPHHIHVVNENRQYRSWNDKDSNLGLNLSNGIISGKQILNQLHYILNSQGFSQAFVDQRDRDTIVVTRHNPNNHKSVVLIARTAFYSLDENYAQYLEPLRIEGKFETILFEIKLDGKPDENYNRDPFLINGYSNLRSIVKLAIDEDNSQMVQLKKKDFMNIIKFKNFSPSSVIAFSFSLLTHQNEALTNIKEQIKEYDRINSDISRIINKLNLIDLNYILFRCHREELEETGGSGNYNLSNGPLVYAGLCGIVFHLVNIRTHNDLGHSLCANLRDGNWLPNYIVNRLKRHSQTSDLASWLQKAFESLSLLPRYLIPRYFDLILCPLYTMLLSQVWILHSHFVRNGNELIKRLALGGVALIGSHSHSPLPPLCTASIPKSFSNLSSNQLPTMSAGLPHFCSSYLRNWGRDTFISLKGLTLLTGRYDEAKVIILGFGGCLRHGLIPNLLDGGNNPRYNCRDAVWWWLQAIKEYIQLVPDGHTILNENVRRIFPSDDSYPLIKESDDCLIEPLHKTMQEALEKHFNGIEFTERNAGSQIDAHMTMEGFKIKIGIDRKTGFVYGGNRWNCGTWMDKMGSSSKAGNRGQPATPRDGSAVELVALSQSVISFLAEMHQKNLYIYEGVTKTDGTGCESWTFHFWNTKIKENFEKFFYINENCTNQYVNRTNIYKDTFSASIPWMDFQLRPNFLIAMSIAPEMFDSKHAIEALNIVSDTLVGPVGIRTLDPRDWTYRGDYDNSNDSNDASVANGFNYHNGPEWLWLIGYYVMARLKFMENRCEEIVRNKQILAKHFEYLCHSEWFGLPELTNTNGSFCSHSCHIQSWSHATLLEALHLIENLSIKVQDTC